MILRLMAETAHSRSRLGGVNEHLSGATRNRLLDMRPGACYKRTSARPKEPAEHLTTTQPPHGSSPSLSTAPLHTPPFGPSLLHGSRGPQFTAFHRQDKRQLSAVRWARMGGGLACLMAALAATPGRAAGPLWVTKLITALPRTEEELAAAHTGSKNSCIQVPAGDPHEVKQFEGETVYDVTVKENGQAVAKKLEYGFSRLNVLSIGLGLLPEDEADLPAVSKNRILSKVGTNYILIQIRVHRERETGNTYLYYKPFAAVGAFGKGPECQEFEPLMETSVRDTRGLGLWSRPGQKPSAEGMRTLVLLNKDKMRYPQPDGTNKDVVDYEFVFIRARLDGDEATLHTFVTSDDRAFLHYMNPWGAEDLKSCSLVHTIYFTEYTAAKQSPSAKVTKHVKINSRARIPAAQLHEFAAAQGWSGDGWDNLEPILDAVIDGKLTAK